MRTRIIFAVLMMMAGEASPPWFGTWTLTTNSDRFKRLTSKIEPWEDGLKSGSGRRTSHRAVQARGFRRLETSAPEARQIPGSLSPLQGWVSNNTYPGLAPGATFSRRSAAQQGHASGATFLWIFFVHGT